MIDADDVNPQVMGLMAEVASRLAEIRNVLILVGLATNKNDSPGSQQAAVVALAKLRELADAFNL